MRGHIRSNIAKQWKKEHPVKYPLPIDLPNDVLLELQRRSRERILPLDELLRDLLEDFVRERNEADKKGQSRTRG